MNITWKVLKRGGAAALLAAVAVAVAVACGSPKEESLASPAGRAEPTTAAPAPASPTSAPGTTPTAAPLATAAPAATAAETPTTVRGQSVEDELRQAGIDTFDWKTKFSKHSVPFGEIFSGGVPKDGIPAIDNPKFVSVDSADEWLEDPEPVLLFEHNGVVRAYPVQILIWHEIVNDVVGGKPVAVTFCPLCNTAIAFDAALGDRRLTFGTTGNLRFSDLVMYDRETESWWQQITGEAIVGEMTGSKLTFLSSPMISWGEFKQTHPDASVLSRETGFPRNYGVNPYTGYDTDVPFLYDGPIDKRLPMTERVAGVESNGEAIAFPFTELEKRSVVHATVGGKDIVVFHKKGTASALDSRFIAEGRDVGSTGVFVPQVDDKRLTFEFAGGQFKDKETGSAWNILGRAVDGELKGKQLEPVVHANHFWFSWAVFQPRTKIFNG